MSTKENQHIERREGEQPKDAHSRPANSDIDTQKDNQIKQRQAFRDGLSAHLGSRDLPKEQRFTLVDTTGAEHTDARHRAPAPTPEQTQQLKQEQINSSPRENGLDAALKFLKNLPAVEQQIVKAVTDAGHPIADKAPVFQHGEQHLAQAAHGDSHLRVRDVKSETHERSGKHEVTALSATQFSEQIRRHFNELDTDHNGSISKEELAKALQNPAYKGELAQALAAAYNRFDTLGGMSDKFGITNGELDKFEVEAKRVRENPTYRIQSCAFGIGESMEENAKLSLSDINKHLQEPNLPDWERTGYQYLKDHFSDIHHWGDSLSKHDVMSIFNSEQSKVFYVQAILDRTSGEQNSGHPDSLFANQENPNLSIKPEDVNQGRSGDCRFDACIMSIAKTHPEVIQKMITEDKGPPVSYLVKFPGVADAIRVSKPTEAELGLYNSGSKDGYWPAVLEKAYGQLLLKNSSISAICKTPQEAVQAMSFEMFSGANILHDLYGKPSEVTNFEGTWFGIDQTKECLKKMRAALTAGEPVTIGTTTDVSKVLPEPLHTGHEYSVVAIDDQGNLTLRNPWGGPEFTVKASDINKENFHSVLTPTPTEHPAPKK